MDEIMDLATRARQGDRVSFGLLYDRYVQDVYRFLLSKTRNKEEAQDLTSTTFIKALQNITSFSPKRNASFRSWLFTIAHRNFLDSTRSGKRHETPLESTEEPQAPHSPARDIENTLLHETLMKALRELSNAQRETIILRVWHDCSFQEIGEILGKSEASTKMLMKRGLVTLQTLIPKAFAAFVVLWEWLTVHG
ncbi:RNA polymerase sigma factor [bacterium]|nr:RNA polymerase sigma factor [bacterium]